MREMLVGLVAALSMGVGVHAAPPLVPAKVTAEVGKLARLEFPVEDGKEVAWGSGTSETNLFVDELVAPKGKKKFLLQGYEPGQYRLLFLTVGEKEMVYVEVEITSPPDKKKEKEAKPEPMPTVVGPLRAYLVTESADKTAAWGKILQDKDVGAWWNGGGNKEVQHLDPNVIDPGTGKPPASWKKYIDGAAGKGSWLYLVDTDSGKTVWEGTPPNSAAAALALFKSVKK